MNEPPHMLEETAVVVGCFPGGILVETSRSSGCSGCQANACSTRWLSRWLPAPRLEVDTELALNIGDQVRVGIPSRSLLQGTLMMYGWPLFLAMVAGGVTERLMAPGHPYVPLMFAGGLLLGVLVGRWHARRYSKLFRPVLLAMN